MNNWILVSMLVFILIATTFPLISEALRGQVVTVGPAYYNKWMVPLGLTLVIDRRALRHGIRIHRRRRRG